MLLEVLTLYASTGHVWCDTDLLARRYASAYGYSIDCSSDERFEHAGWVDHGNRRIVIWPESTGSAEYTRKVLLHEVSHIVNGKGEETAEHFSYCVRLENVQYFAPTPSAAECDRVVGDPVTHAYAAFLGRMPDDEGWTYWTYRLEDLGQSGVHHAIGSSLEAKSTQ